MDYKKAYDELVEKLKQFYKYGMQDSQQIKEFACNFPEVLEGDEKDDFIRDNLVDLIRNREDSERYAGMFLDWVARHDIKDANFEEEKPTKRPKRKLFPIAIMPKKDPPKPPVKHNFANGDFIVAPISPRTIAQVLVVGINSYALRNCVNGENYNLQFHVADLQYHLWTIDDAAPGDILLSEQDEICCMFRKKLNDKLMSVYCFKREYNDNFTIQETTLESSHFHPAYFEKADEFITKLRQVGYEFNSAIYGLTAV